MKTLKVKDFMIKNPVILHPDDPIALAVSRFVQHNQFGGPVIDKGGNLAGWLSEHDCLGLLLTEGYYEDHFGLVRDKMNTHVETIGPDYSIVELAQRMLAHKPNIFPVVEKGVLLGVIDRHHVLYAITTYLGDQFHHGTIKA